LVADAGDVYLTMYNVPQAANDIHQQYTKLLSTGCKLLSIGGDHTITYPILKAYRVCAHLFNLFHCRVLPVFFPIYGHYFSLHVDVSM